MNVLFMTIAAFAPTACACPTAEAQADDETQYRRWAAALGSSSSAVRQAAAQSLRRAGERAIPALAEAVGDDRSEIRRRALNIVLAIVERADEAALERIRARLAERGKPELIRQVNRRAAAIRQQRSLAALQVLDAEVVLAPPAGIAIDPLTPEGQALIQRLPMTVTGFRMHRVKDYSTALPLLQDFPELRSLKLSTPRLTDADLIHVEPLTGLRSIELYNTNVGDEGMRRLAALKELQELHLGYANITDAGLAHLRGLRRLESLNLLGDAHWRPRGLTFDLHPLPSRSRPVGHPDHRCGFGAACEPAAARVP